MPTKRQTFERWGEALAEYLTKKGYKIIEGRSNGLRHVEFVTDGEEVKEKDKFTF